MTDTARSIGIRNRLMAEVRCRICREVFGDANKDICDMGTVNEHTFVIDTSTVPKELPVAEIVQAIGSLFGRRMANSWFEQLSSEGGKVCNDYD